MRTNTPELSLWSRILKTTRSTQFPILPPFQYSSPIPPCVRINPFSTVSPPGPTCCQPFRSFPSKSCFHSAEKAAVEAQQEIASAAINDLNMVNLEEQEISYHRVFAFFGLPFRNKRVVERQPLALEHKHPDALAFLEGTGQVPLSGGLRNRLQRQRNFTAVHHERIIFKTQREVTRRRIVLLETNDPPMHNSTRRSEDVPATVSDSLQ